MDSTGDDHIQQMNQTRKDKCCMFSLICALEFATDTQNHVFICMYLLESRRGTGVKEETSGERATEGGMGEVLMYMTR